ncbi:MAG: hypothetical protein JSR27_11725 [Proteobacteria bacterium]|nr:hypothetical protein [Pseudomonadota bacterium]
MTPQALLETAVLLGFFVLAGGGYAGLYSIGRLRANIGLVRAGALCWFTAFGIALVVAAATPLDAGWKLFILASALVYAAIPPMTWRYLERLHDDHSPEGAGQ